MATVPPSPAIQLANTPISPHCLPTTSTAIILMTEIEVTSAHLTKKEP